MAPASFRMFVENSEEAASIDDQLDLLPRNQTAP
ncbi:hypothetical protein NJ75_01095 [Novosphingobium subterraneum]|uniref:Uncharacterized protein n=1 Tax=Novosphingobium subterraneum TaxID=48936 RepID=A0A0B9AGH8_9SPHN|nr:hypothetical protein NJ75_01095 [Novosphingobium subterraneum]